MTGPWRRVRPPSAAIWSLSFRIRGLVTDPWVEPRARALGRHGCRLLKGYRTGRRAVVTPFLGANRRNGASGRGQRDDPRPDRGCGQIAGVGPLLVADVIRKRRNGLTDATSTSPCIAWSAKRAVGDAVSRTKTLDVAPRPLTYPLPEPTDVTSPRPDPHRPTDPAGAPDFESVGDQIDL